MLSNTTDMETWIKYVIYACIYALSSKQKTLPLKSQDSFIGFIDVAALRCYECFLRFVGPQKLAQLESHASGAIALWGSHWPLILWIVTAKYGDLIPRISGLRSHHHWNCRFEVYEKLVEQPSSLLGMLLHE